MRVCDICGKTEKEGRIVKSVQFEKLLCNKHYRQMQNRGKIYDTFREPNKIELKEDHAELILVGRDLEEVGRVMLDLEDVELVSKYRWYFHDNRYAYTRSTGRNQSMHGILMNPKGLDVVDHIDSNGLNNRRSNLHVVTQQENAQKKRIQRNNTSGIIGISKNGERWVAEMKIKGKRVLYKSTRYEDKIPELIRARLQAEKEYLGEYAPQKHLFEEYGI